MGNGRWLPKCRHRPPRRQSVCSHLWLVWCMQVGNGRRLPRCRHQPPRRQSACLLWTHPMNTCSECSPSTHAASAMQVLTPTHFWCLVKTDLLSCCVSVSLKLSSLPYSDSCCLQRSYSEKFLVFVDLSKGWKFLIEKHCGSAGENFL